jgi:Uma2 family endonuclease
VTPARKRAIIPSVGESIAMNEHVTAGRRPASYQDVLDAPPHTVAELVGGTLHLHPRPASRHAYAASSLADELVSPFQKGRGGPGGWWILLEPELHLGADVLVPDLAGWRRERLPAFPDAPWFEVAPDWACEVLSPGTRRLDRTEKRDIYGAAGVGDLWLVDPKERTLEAFTLRGSTWTLVATLRDADEVRLAPFEAVGFPLGALWPD